MHLSVEQVLPSSQPESLLQELPVDVSLPLMSLVASLHFRVAAVHGSLGRHEQTVAT